MRAAGPGMGQHVAVGVDEGPGRRKIGADRGHPALGLFESGVIGELRHVVEEF